MVVLNSVDGIREIACLRTALLMAAFEKPMHAANPADTGRVFLQL